MSIVSYHDKDRIRIQRILRTNTERIGNVLMESHFTGNPMDVFKKFMNYAHLKGVKDYSHFILNMLKTENSFPISRKTRLLDVKDDSVYFGGNFYREKKLQSSFSPMVSSVFDWPLLDIYIEMTGLLEETSDKEQDYYYSMLSREEQKSLTVFNKTTKVHSRESLLHKYTTFNLNYYKRPSYWSAFRCIPIHFEFVKKHSNFVDDRLVYVRSHQTKEWSLYRSSPVL